MKPGFITLTALLFASFGVSHAFLSQVVNGDADAILPASKPDVKDGPITCKAVTMMNKRPKPRHNG